jgi:hypothetical protein
MELGTLDETRNVVGDKGARKIRRDGGRRCKKERVLLGRQGGVESWRRSAFGSNDVCLTVHTKIGEFMRLT